MMESGAIYGSGLVSRDHAINATAQTRPYRPPSVLERLTDEKLRCEARLQEVNNALALLEANPATTAVLEALSKIGF